MLARRREGGRRRGESLPFISSLPARAHKPHLTRASSTCSRAVCGVAECSVLYRSAARDRTAVTYILIYNTDNEC